MKKRRKLIWHRFIIFLIICALILFFILSGLIKAVNFISSFNTSSPFSVRNHDYPDIDLQLNAKQYLISSEENFFNFIQASKGHNDRIYPASLTKLMTMYVVLNHVDESDLDNMLEVSYLDLEGLIANNASVMGLNVGDTISVRNALYGLILSSGADCANVLKNYIESKGFDFIAEMNNLALKIGMHDSHFTNVTGLFDEDNYSTLYDINILMHQLKRNEVGKEILTTLTRNDDGYTIESTMFPLSSEYKTINAEILGGKTGFTAQSHLNLAAVVKANNKYHFILLAGADEQGDDGMYSHLSDAVSIINYQK